MKRPSSSAPGPSPQALLCSIPRIQSDPLGYLMSCAHRYGDVTQFNAGTVTAFFLNHPEAVKHVLQDNHHNYSKDTMQYNALATITGRGLLTSDGPTWLRQRRLAQPAFARPRLVGIAPLVAEATQRLFNHWQPACQRGEALDIDREMMRLTLEVVGRALFGADLSGDAQALTGATLTALDHIIYKARNVIVPPDWLPTRRSRQFKAALKVLDRAVYSMIASRRTAAQHGDALPDDLFSMLLNARDEETGEGMSDRQLRDEMITLLIAGHETVASALTWSWYLLSLNPTVRRALQAEAHAVLSMPDDPALRDPTAADLPNLPYTRAVFDEALRLYPPAWLITRKAMADDEVLGHALPAGSLIILSPYVLHRHPDFWPNPEGFDPARFHAPAADAARPRYAYIPFGGGPRLCIGNTFAQTEATLILAAISARFSLDLQPGASVQVEPLVTLRPRHGLPMRVKPI